MPTYSPRAISRPRFIESPIALPPEAGIQDVFRHLAQDPARTATIASAITEALRQGRKVLALTGLAGRLVAEAIAGDAARFDTFARLRHRPFPGGRLLRTPALVMGMAYYRLRDML